MNNPDLKNLLKQYEQKRLLHEYELEIRKSKIYSEIPRLKEIDLQLANISKKLGLTRKLTQYEEAYIEKWICEYNYNFDIIEIALKKTTSKTNPNFDYLDKMISDWKDRNLSTSDDIKNYLLEFKNKTKKVQELQKKTNYNNYEQRNVTNFDNLYANK